jgi:hypothetical protein
MTVLDEGTINPTRGGRLFIPLSLL